LGPKNLETGHDIPRLKLDDSIKI